MNLAAKLTGVAAAGVIAASAALSHAQDKPAGKKIFSGKQEKEIRRLVKEYLLKHPEIIVQAMQELRARQRREQLARAKAAIKKNRQSLLADKYSVVGGNPKGDVTIVEFFDYRCGYCKAVKPQLDGVLKRDPNVRIVYKEFPILGPDSTLAARAAIASRKQGDKMYVKFHDALMAAQNVNEDTILATAKKVGLNISKLQRDMDHPDVAETIRRNHELAQKLGIRGTPAFVIGDEMVPGAIGSAQMAARVARARAACKKEKAKLC